MKNTAIAFLSVAIAPATPGVVHLVPFGEFVGRDGRPTDEGIKWKLFDPEGRVVAARLNAYHHKVRFNFDYEHQALLSAQNGQPAPASGWATRFEWRDGQGLFAVDVKWTAAAQAAIDAGEYAYISPAILYSKKTGQVLGVHNASLTNIPNLDGLNPVAEQRLASLSAIFSTTPEIDSMNPLLEALLQVLGLTAETTPDQAKTVVAALKAQAAAVPKPVLAALSLGDGASEADATTAIAALKAKPGQGDPDPTKWVSLDKFNELNTQVAALTAQSAGREVDALIDQAKAEGKLTPAAEQVWRDVGKASIAQLKALIDKTPANPALAGKTQTSGGNAGKGQDGQLSDTELAICKATGVDPKDYAAAKVAEAA